MSKLSGRWALVQALVTLIEKDAQEGGQFEGVTVLPIIQPNDLRLQDGGRQYSLSISELPRQPKKG